MEKLASNDDDVDDDELQELSLKNTISNSS